MGDIMKDIFLSALVALTIGLPGANSAVAGSKVEKITAANAAAWALGYRNRGAIGLSA